MWSKLQETLCVSSKSCSVLHPEEGKRLTFEHPNPVTYRFSDLILNQKIGQFITILNVLDTKGAKLYKENIPVLLHYHQPELADWIHS